MKYTVVIFFILFLVINIIDDKKGSELYVRELTVLSSKDPLSGLSATEKVIKIKSIDKTLDDKLSLYLLFDNPSTKKEDEGYRMTVSSLLSVTDTDGHLVIKSIVQEINKAYSYEPDSGSFIFSLNLPKKNYSLKFIVKDLISGKEDERVVPLKF